MTYLELINQFWQIRRTTDFSHMEADFYFFLLNEANLRFWVNPIPISTRTITHFLNMTNKQVVETRNKLKQKKLIDFTEGSRRADIPNYTITDVLVSVGNQNGNQNRNQNGNQNRNQNGNQNRNPIREEVRQETKEEEEYTHFALEKVFEECDLLGLSRDKGQEFYDHYHAVGWIDGQGRKIVNLRSAVTKWKVNQYKHNGVKHEINGGNRSAAPKRGGTIDQIEQYAREWELLAEQQQHASLQITENSGG